MKVIRNIGLIERKRKRTRWFIGIGLLLLGTAVVSPLLNPNPNLVIGAYGALIVGFFMFIYGTQQHSKWARKPRADQVVDHVLSRVNDRNTIIHFPDLGANSPEHILVTPGGVLVLTLKDVGGKITVSGKRWRQRRLFLLKFFNLGAPSLGNPTLENELQLDRLEEIFNEKTLPGDLEGAIVFMPDDVEIAMKDPDSTVIHISELLDFVREVGSDVQLSNRERNQLVDALSVGEEMDASGARPGRPKKRLKVSQ